MESTLPFYGSGSGGGVPTDKVTTSPIARHLKITDDELSSRPWKYLGYRAFSKWAASEKSFLVVRQFSSLNARIILSLQDEISLLEEQLDVLEAHYSGPTTGDYNNSTLRQESQGTPRKILLNKIYIALEKYSKCDDETKSIGWSLTQILDRFINEYTVMQNRPAAPKNDIQSIQRWLHVNHSGAIDDDETKFINVEEDLVTVRPNPKSPMRRHIESSMWAMGFFPKTFQRQPREGIVIDGLTRWYDDKKV